MNHRTKKAFGLLELVITIGIIVVAMLAFANAAVTFLRASIISTDPHVAAHLAQEGVEAIRALRDKSWSAHIAPLVNGTQYYPVASGSAWSVSTTNPGPLQGKYTRSVIMSAVNRDAGGKGDILQSGGTFDPNTKTLVVTIQWVDEQGAARTHAVSTYITNFLGN